MRFSGIFYTCTVLLTPSMATSQPYSEIAQEYVMSHYIEAGETGWRYRLNPPQSILNSASSIYASYIEGMGEVDSDVVAAKTDKETTADFHDIMVFSNEETNLFRVVWIYVWENATCNSYDFSTETFTLTLTGEVYDRRVGPSIGQSGTVCTSH